MVSIRTATTADAAAVAATLSEAFRDDPAWALSLPDDASRQRELARYYERAARRHPERVDVAEEDGRVLGAMLFDPPATRWRLASGLVSRFASRLPIRRGELSRLASRRLGGVAATVLSRLQRVVPGNALRGLVHSRAVGAYRPIEPHWYLRDIAASPRARGRGVGSALLRHRLAVVDAGGREPVFLEATSAGSRRLYERFGFRAVGTVPTRPGEVSTAMIRPPAAGPRSGEDTA